MVLVLARNQSYRTQMLRFEQVNNGRDDSCYQFKNLK